MKKLNFTLTELLVVVPIIFIFTILGAGVVGYGANIYKLSLCDFKPSYKAEAIRTVGIFVPPVGGTCGLLQDRRRKGRPFRRIDLTHPTQPAPFS